MDTYLENIDWGKAKEIFAPEKESFLKKAKQTWEKYPQAEEALKILAAFGIISLGLIMPGPTALVVKELTSRERYRYSRMWRRWEKEKLVEIDYSGADPVVKITQKGMKRALKYKLDGLRIKKPLRWDKKWRVIIFDVVEARKKNRDYFRSSLIMLGFYRLNDSVFVYPYPCFDEIEYLRQISGIGQEVTHMTVESIETGANLRNYFSLD